MDKNIYLYYCYNKTFKTERTSKKTKVKSVKITFIPEHISIRILKNTVTPEGFVLPSCQKLVAFPEHNPEAFDLIKRLLVPKLNMNLALQNIENKIEVIRRIAVAIVRGKAIKKKFDDWLTTDSQEYTSLR